MAVLSAVCNYNPVIFLKYPPNYTLQGPGDHRRVAQPVAPALQRQHDGNLLARTRSRCSRRSTSTTRRSSPSWSGMLDGIKNPDGSTLLDNTATVWFNEMSDGNAHNLNNLPIIQAGGCGGYFKSAGRSTRHHATGAPPPLTRATASRSARTARRLVGQRPHPETGTTSTVGHAPDQQVLLQPDERDGREGGRDRIPGQGRHRTGDEVRLFRPDHGFHRWLGRGPGATIHNPGEFTTLKP